MPTPRLDGITVIAAVLIASFAVDRIVTGILVLLSYLEIWRRTFPAPELLPEGVARERAARNLKVVYFCLAAALAIPLMAGFGQIRILAALGFQSNAFLDLVVTGLILIGGSDRLAEILKLTGPGPAKSEPKPITITGKLVLEDSHGRAVGTTSG